MDKLVEVFLRGRQFKKYSEKRFADFRTKYNLKEIEREMILVVSEVPGCDTVASIHRYLDANKGHISQALFSLNQKGFMEVVPDAKDRRVVHYILTEKGVSAGAEIKKIWDELTKELFKGISREELMEFKGMFLKIEENIENVIH